MDGAFRVFKDDDQTDAGILLSANAYRTRVRDAYRLTLMHPTKHYGAKIPTEFPLPSATACLKWNFNLTPNATGKICVWVDPFKRSPNVYNDSTLNGDGVAGTPVAFTTETGFTLASGSSFIDMFRVVSAEVKVTYIGTLQNVSGYIGGSVHSNLSVPIEANARPIFTKFENLENSSDKVIVSPLQGLRLVYVPRDPEMLEYFDIAGYQNETGQNIGKYLMIIHGDGLPTTTCLRLDYCLNIEYVAKISAKEYIYHSMDTPARYDSSMTSSVSLASSLS